eukprot:gene5149-8755_t
MTEKISESFSFMNSDSSCSAEDTNLDITNSEFAEHTFDDKDSCQHDYRPYKGIYMRCLKCEVMREATDQEKKAIIELKNKNK